MVARTNCELLMDIVRTGQPFKIAYVWVCRINDKEIAEVGSPTDDRGFLQQLGVIPVVASNRSLIQPTDNEYS